MFKIYLLNSANYPTELYNDANIYSPIVFEPELEMNGDNGILIGKLTFKLHEPSYSPQLRLLQNTVIVTQMIAGVETVIFRGRPLLRDDDDYNDQDFTFEGILAGLNDTLQTPSNKRGVRFYEHFITIIDWHNHQVQNIANNRQIDYSKIDKTDPTSHMYTITRTDAVGIMWEYMLDYTRFRASTMDHLKTQYVDAQGGYFYLENEPFVLDTDGCVILHNYLKYIDIYNPNQAHVSTQRIEFGKNLISIKRTASADNFATVLVPLGKQLTDIDKTWPYYQSISNNQLRKITTSPDSAEVVGYTVTGAYINAETGAVVSGVGSSYVIPGDVDVEYGDVFYLTTYLEGISTNTSIASYSVMSRDGQQVFSIGSTVRNSSDSVGKLVLKDYRIEIPKPENDTIQLKLRTSYFISANDPNGGFVLKKFNKNYQENNVTIMSGNQQLTGDIRKTGQYSFGRDVYPDATDTPTAPETYEESKRLVNKNLFDIFGSIEKSIEIPDYGADQMPELIRIASNQLRRMGEDLEIEIQAADLSYIDEDQEPFSPYDLVPVYSEPHSIDLMLPIVKMTLPLADPAAATYTLQNDIHLSEESKKYISQMVSSPSSRGEKKQTVVIYGGGPGGGGGSTSVGVVRYDQYQSLSESQKAQARSNIGVGSGGEAVVDAVLYTPQTLTEAQQAQARENIGVTASDSDLPEPTDADNGKVLGIRNGQYVLVDDQTGDDSTFPEDTEIDLSKVAWEIGAFNSKGKNFDVGDAAVVSEFATTSYTTIQSGKIRIALASSSTIPSGYTPNVTITKPGGGTYDLSSVVWEYGSIGRGGQNLNGVTDRIRTKDSIDVEAGAVVSCSAFSTYNEGMRVVELNMDLFRRVRTIGFIKAPARTVISCSDFTLCEKGLRVCEYAAPDLSLNADVVSSIAPRNYRVTKSCYIRILLASDTIRYDLPLNTGSQYDGQMMTSVASEIVHAMIPAQTVRPSNAYTRRTGIPRIILPWSGYELLTTTTADAELPSTNKLSMIYGKWDALMAQYSGYIEKETVGYGEKPSGDSNEYPIYAYTLRSYIPTPDNPNRNPNSQFKFTYDKPQKNLEIIWIGTIHAHEHTVPVDDFKFFSELMKRENEVTDLLMLNCDFTVIPIMNPYGYEHFNEILNDVPNAGVRCGRVNANGVNLNRNFPEQWQYIEPFVEGEPNNDYAGAEAASESEVQAVMAFLTAHSDAYICVNRHTSAEFAPTSVLAYFASIIEEDTKIALNACRFMDAQMHHSDLYANYIGTVKASDFDKVQDTDSRCLYTVQKSETPGTMDKWYNAVLGLDGFLFEMSPSDHNYANSPWGREVWQRINVTGIGNMLYAVMLQNEYIPKG